ADDAQEASSSEASQLGEDSEDEAMQSSGPHNMPKFTYDEFPFFQQAVCKALVGLQNRKEYAKGHFPITHTLNILRTMPVPGSSFAAWHKEQLPTLEQDAEAWLAAKDPTAKFDGEALMDFYVNKLEKHFEPEMISSKVSQYIPLRQTSSSPKSYLRQVRELVPYIKEHYPLSTIARRYVMRLEPRVRDHVLGKYGSVDNKLWYERLGEIADYAEQYWQNLVQIKAEDEDYEPAPASVWVKERSSSAQREGHKAVASTSAQRHDKEELSLDERIARAVKAALATQLGAAPIQPKPGQQAPARQRDAQVCEYCGCKGHEERYCLILHPDQAEPGWEPRALLLRRLFQQNKEKLQAQPQQQQQARPLRAAAVAAVVQSYDDEEEVYVPHCRNANVSTTRAAEVKKKLRVHWSKEVLEQSGAAEEEAHGGVCATLTHQAPPLSFEPVEIKSDVYPLPRVAPRTRPQPRIQPDDALHLRLDITAGLSRMCRVMNLLQEEEEGAKPETVARIASAAPAARGVQPAVQPAPPQVKEVDQDAAAGQAQHAAASVAIYTRTTPSGVPYCIAGAAGGRVRGIEDIPSSVMGMLLKQDQQAASYFDRKQLMFYYPEAAMQVGATAAPQLRYLRDHCADVNLITRRAAALLGLPIRRTSTGLNTSADQDAEVIGEVETQGIRVIILPGTAHEVQLGLTQTLVVEQAAMYDVLIGNDQMHPVADAITQYPVAQLHVYPNLLEHPKYIVSIPMTTVKLPTKGAIVTHKRVAFVACSSSVNPSHRRGWGGGCSMPMPVDPMVEQLRWEWSTQALSVASSVGSMAISAVNNSVGAEVPKVELQPDSLSGRWQSGVG
ncbi:hypothetical protein Vretifemale_3417, partial [Volvox reticuliferus]